MGLGGATQLGPRESWRDPRKRRVLSPVLGRGPLLLQDSWLFSLGMGEARTVGSNLTKSGYGFQSFFFQLFHGRGSLI